MKLSLSLLAFLVLPLGAQASTSCAGVTREGVVIRIDVQTEPTRGAVTGAGVTIYPTADRGRYYALKAQDIPQFREDASADLGRAYVGLLAYDGGENPVSLRYVGANYAEDVVRLIRVQGRMIQEGEMRVWKGPGFKPNEQWLASDVVCQVSLDP